MGANLGLEKRRERDEKVNAALRQMFACFTIREDPGDDLFDGILIQPWLLPGAIALPADPELGWAWPKLVKATDDPPPLLWLQNAASGSHLSRLPPEEVGTSPRSAMAARTSVSVSKS